MFALILNVNTCLLYIFKQDGLLFCVVAFSYGISRDVIISWLVCVAKIYPTTVLTLFCIFCLLISDQLEIIRDQIEQVSNRNPFDTSAVSRHLVFLQKQHILISKSICAVNITFGPVMLFEVPFIFIGVINTLVINLLSKQLELFSITYSVITLANYISNFLIICLSAEKIKTQVNIH